VLAHKSRTKSPRNTKIGREVDHSTGTDTVEFHGGLAFVHHNSINFRKRTVDCDIKPFEYL